MSREDVADNVVADVSVPLDEALQIALLLHRTSCLVEAEGLYRRILAEVPEHVDPLHYLALLCHQTGRLAEAEELIRRIIAINPGLADAHNNLGNVLEGVQRPDEAAECYRRAIELDPCHAAAHNNLGVILMQQNRVDDAVAVYRRGVELAPESADFHNNLGNALRRSRDAVGAAEAYRQAVTLDPEHPTAWHGLARTLMAQGKYDEAAGAFDEWLREKPDDPSARYLRAACLGETAPDRAPDEYIRQVFDTMADRFDAHLQNLHYRAPTVLAEAVSGVFPEPRGTLDVIDAGCGTGLCGPLLRAHARRLTGVDLSPSMLAKAESRGVYDELQTGELTSFLRDNSNAYDLVVSSDTLCYFGSLKEVVDCACGALRAGGVVAFTVEDAADDTVQFRLHHAGRYAHGRPYVEAVLRDAGLQIQAMTSTSLRNEDHTPVAGLVVVARKPAAVAA